VQLFVARAQAADPRFIFDDRVAPAVAAICRRLDGIPLALEMAAARAPLLGLEGLAARLDERFRVLTAGKRTALPRQRTLHATLDWSFSLLSPREQAVFRRLGVFAGSFTLSAAAAVAPMANTTSPSSSKASRVCVTNRSSRQTRAKARCATGCSRRRARMRWNDWPMRMKRHPRRGAMPCITGTSSKAASMTGPCCPMRRSARVMRPKLTTCERLSRGRST
jgi:predicted ATPase